MSDDLRGLVCRAILEPEDEPPVAALVRRAGRRRRRRHASLGLVGLVLVGLVAIVAADLGVARVDLTPAGPVPQSGGWPLEARFEIIDLDYGEFVQQPSQPVALTVEELAAGSWDDWTHVVVASYELRADGRTLLGDDRTGHAQRVTGVEGAFGRVALDDPDRPFAALEAAADAELPDRTVSMGWAPGRLFWPGPAGVESLADVPDHPDAHNARDRVAGELDVPADELLAVVTEDVYCGLHEGVDGDCPQPLVHVERTFVIHVPTGLPLYRSWRPVEGMPDELAALGLDELVELRATHIRFTGDGGPPADGETVILDVPPEGEAAPQWLPGGVPVLVVHDRGGRVWVVESVSPHAPAKVAQPLGWCPHGYFVDARSGSAFDPDGRWIGGPAPSDLVSYRTRPGSAPDTVEVLERVVPELGRPRDQQRGYSESCRLEGQEPQDLVSHDASQDRVWTASEALRERPGGWVLVDGSVGVDDDGRVWACDGRSPVVQQEWQCPVGEVAMGGLDTGGRVGAWLYEGPMWVVVTEQGLQRPAHPLIDRLPPERRLDPPTSAPAPAPAPTGEDVVTVPAVDIDYQLPSKRAEAPAGTFRLVLDNQGSIVHTLVIDGVHLEAQGGEWATVTVDWPLEPGEHIFYCVVPGHRAAGMEGTLVVQDPVEDLGRD